MTTEAVIAEVFYVLAGPVYRTPRPEVAMVLRPMITLRALRMDNKQVVLGALDVIEAHPSLDFEDALIIARMASEKIEELYSYDSDFERVASVKRLEPATV